MPHVLPHGVSAEGVGLRQAASPVLAAPAPPPRMPVMAVSRSRAAPAPMGPPQPAPVSPTGGRAEAQKKSAATGARRATAREESVARPTDAASDSFPIALDAPDFVEQERSSSAREQQEARPVRTLRARIVSSRDGRLVLEFDVDGALDWDPSRAVVVDATGHRLGATLVNGTTRASALSAGQVARLVLSWTGPTPTRIEIGDLHLVFA